LKRWRVRSKTLAKNGAAVEARGLKERVAEFGVYLPEG